MKPTVVGRTPRRVSVYQEIADEYYDPIRHPTSRDLGFLSRKIILSLVQTTFSSAGTLVEMGAGDSILASAEAFRDLHQRIILLDNSPKMLLHTKNAINFVHILTSAKATGLPSQSAALVVASLGDPYNCFALWKEVERLLEANGKCVFTTPSFEWSSRFRNREEIKFAEFLKSDGQIVLMPSYIYNRGEQTAMIESAGLRVEQVKGIGADALDHAPAPKLTCVAPSTPVVSAYVVSKRI